MKEGEVIQIVGGREGESDNNAFETRFYMKEPIHYFSHKKPTYKTKFFGHFYVEFIWKFDSYNVSFFNKTNIYNSSMKML